MTDIATIYSDAALRGDLSLDGADLASDEGLETAVLHSIFTDARARDDDELPGGELGDGRKRGWWGDSTLEPLSDGTADKYGSRLWLLKRRKITKQTVEMAREMLEECLAWLVSDGVAAKVTVDVWRYGQSAVAATVEIKRKSGTNWTKRFDQLWE